MRIISTGSTAPDNIALIPMLYVRLIADDAALAATCSAFHFAPSLRMFWVECFIIGQRRFIGT
jgi:hypothetical protein